jgi:hypothetical protein
MASLSISSLSLNNGAAAPTATAMTIFPDFPLEIQLMIWTEAALEPEIVRVYTEYSPSVLQFCGTLEFWAILTSISQVDIHRRVKESPAKRDQEPNHTAKSQINFDYIITCGPVDLNGNKVSHSKLRAVNKQSRATYFHVRSHEIYLHDDLERKVFFNPHVDALYFSDFTSIYSHHRRQRYRRKMPMIVGLDSATKIAFDPVPDNDRFADLSEEVVDDFEIRVKKIQQDWKDNGQAYKLDMGWKNAVLAEAEHLIEEMKPRNIKISRALGRVNGGYIDANATILRLPLTQVDLA